MLSNCATPVTTSCTRVLPAGTSMAAPYVSGAAALAIAASGGTLTNAQVGRLNSCCCLFAGPLCPVPSALCQCTRCLQRCS